MTAIDTNTAIDTSIYHSAAVKRKLGGVLYEQPRDGEPAWVEEARSLRRKLWSLQMIADHLGLSYRQVYKQLNYRRVIATDKRSDQNASPERKADQRFVARESRRKRAPFCTIVGCGKRLMQPTRHPDQPAICQECRRRLGRERRAQIAGLWLAGYTTGEIARMTGDTPARAGATIHRMRQEGWDLPYRRGDKAKA